MHIYIYCRSMCSGSFSLSGGPSDDVFSGQKRALFQDLNCSILSFRMVNCFINQTLGIKNRVFLLGNAILILYAVKAVVFKLMK